jgi:adenosylhomocysteine nucleosidase
MYFAYFVVPSSTSFRMPLASALVTFALPQESRDFREALHRRPREGIRVEHFGVGPAAAAERIGRLLAAEKPRLLICAGFAGGLDPRLVVGDLVIAENLSTADVLALARAAATQDQPRCVFGSILSQSMPVESVPGKAALFRDTGALAVDMESEAVAAACRAAAVPLLVVRTISDPAGTPLPVPFAEWFDLERQRPRVVGLVKYLAFHPDRIGPFAHFVRSLTPARQALAEFLRRFLEDLEHSAG